MTKADTIINNLFKNLIEMESNLSGLYLVLSNKSTGNLSAVFKKISIDSMNHGETLRLIKTDLTKNLSFSIPSEELNNMTEKAYEICAQIKNVINEVKGADKINQGILTKLNKLEGYENDALAIYIKFHKSYLSSNNKVKIVQQLIEGIINDEKEHSMLLQSI